MYCRQAKMKVVVLSRHWEYHSYDSISSSNVYYPPSPLLLIGISLMFIVEDGNSNETGTNWLQFNSGIDFLYSTIAQV